jgi:hypothetical protein
VNVLLSAVAGGPMTLDVARDGFGYAEGYDEKEQRYRGLVVGAGVANAVADGRSVLGKPGIAATQEAEHEPAGGEGAGATQTTGDVAVDDAPGGAAPPRRRPTRFYGRKSVNATRVGRDAGEIANELVATSSLSSVWTSK